MTSLLAASLLLTNPAPLEMPRAEAYLVKEGGRYWLEDRYSTEDLWVSQTVDGVWIDEAGRVFMCATLRTLPPAVASESGMTRVDYADESVVADPKDDRHLRRQVSVLSPVDPDFENFARPRQSLRGFKDVRYYQGTNASAIVCAYLPERTNVWFYASWELLPTDDPGERLGQFENDLLGEVRGKRIPPLAPVSGERELLRRDAAHSVAAYDRWHFTSSAEFVILDDLVAGRDFVMAITNELPALRRRFAETVPSPIDGSNVLAVARIFRDRADYVAAVGEEMRWSAACWNPLRRELVACLPPDGNLSELRRTFRHEAFHQYLSYASSMIETSPWLNEGYAQYFENPDDDRFRLDVPQDKWDELELALPEIMRMDYAAFYAGTDDDRRLKYRVAWSIARFLETGARELRFDPYRDVVRDYMRALLKTRDPVAATEVSFANTDLLRRFANEWKNWWMEHQ